MPAARRTKGAATAEQRASLLLPLYLSLGAQRSQRLVHSIATKAGVSVSLTTIANYASRFGWVEKAQAYDRQLEGERTVVVLERAVADEVRMAEVWRQVQESGAARLLEYDAMHTKTEKNPGADPPPLIEIARVLDLATKNQRLISGLATQRIDIASSAYRLASEGIGPLVVQFAEAVIADAARYVTDEGQANLMEARTREHLSTFAREADRLLDAAFRAAGLDLTEATVEDDEDDA